MTPFGIEHGENRNTESAEGVPISTSWRMWHVGESRWNDATGRPLLVACLQDVRSGVERAVVYHRAYGFDSLARAYSAEIVPMPEGWSPQALKSPAV